MRKHNASSHAHSHIIALTVATTTRSCWLAFAKRATQSSKPSEALLVRLVQSVTIARRQLLKEHMKTHDPDRKLFRCQEDGCTKFFTKASNLSVHVRSYHRKEK